MQWLAMHSVWHLKAGQVQAQLESCYMLLAIALDLLTARKLTPVVVPEVPLAMLAWTNLNTNTSSYNIFKQPSSGSTFLKNLFATLFDIGPFKKAPGPCAELGFVRGSGTSETKHIRTSNHPHLFLRRCTLHYGVFLAIIGKGLY